MRLTSFQVEKYGNFDRLELTLDPAPQRINLLVAPNGAGKSVLRQAFSDLLFGIGGQTPMGFRHGYSGMRLAAAAEAADGALIRFARRKGQGNTLLDAAGQPQPPAHLRPLLGDADRLVLEQLFALDTAALRAGGAALLQGQGALGDALVSAAGGVGAARQVRVALETARDALAPTRRAAQRPFYKALDALTDAQRALHLGVVKPEAWQRQETLLAAARAARAAANVAQQLAGAALARLNRIRRSRPLLASHAAAAAWLEQHPEAPTLPADLSLRLPQAREALQRSQDAVARAEAAAAEQTARRDALQPDAVLLAEAGAVAALVQDLGAARKAERDLPPIEAGQQAARRRIGDLLHQLGQPQDAAASALVPPRAVLREARERFSRHEALTAPLSQLPRTIDALEHRRAALAADLAALPEAADTEALAALVQEIRAAGDPGTQALAAATDIAGLRAAAGVALGRVPCWSGDVAALAELAPAALPAYERLYAAAETAERKRTETGAALAARRAASADSRRRLAALGDAGDLPDAAAIQAARTRRDAGWALVFRIGFTAAPPSSDEVAGWTGGAPLPVAYPEAVAQADAMADRRMLETDRLAAVAELTRLIGEQVAGERQDEAALADGTAGAAAAALAWHQATARFGLAAPTLAELRDVLAFREAALQAAGHAQAAVARAAALAERHAAWAARLGRALGAAGDLPALLADAEAALAQQRKLAERRATTAAQFAATTEQMEHAVRDRRDRERALATWQADWAALLPRLGRPADEPPSVTSALLDMFEQLDREVREEAALAGRIDGMRAEIARFGHGAGRLAQILAPAIREQPPAAVVHALQAQVAEAQRDAALRKQAEQDLAAAQLQAEVARAALAAAAADLHAIVAAAGAADVEAAAIRIALAEQRREQAALLACAAQGLADEGDGLPLETLRAEANGLGADELTGAIAAANEASTAASAAAQQAAAEAGRLATEMGRLAGEDTAIAAAANAAAAGATLSQVLDEAMLMHTAAELLAAALGRVEADSSDSLLARIARAFETLTCGDYASVAVHDNKGIPSLLLTERAGAAGKWVDQLSEGTRDQLYLALRLVAIEDYAAGAPALPFLADDILQTFDDVRALAAMRELVTFSATAQVIVLTHHHHVLDLVAELPAGCVNIVTI